MLEDNVWRFRWKAAEKLGTVGDSRSIGPLAKRVLADKDWIVRWEAVYSLAKLRDLRAIEPLEQALGDENCEVRRASAEALQKLIAGLKLEQKAALFCSKCICHFDEDRVTLFPFHQKYMRECADIFEEQQIVRSPYQFTFRAFCRECALISFQGDIAKVVLILDRRLKGPLVHNSCILLVNWFNHKKPFDFGEIWIVNAEDFDIEEFVMILKNDTDEQRRQRLGSILVYLNPESGLSQAKHNLLRDTFNKMEPLLKAEYNTSLKSIDTAERDSRC